jgi:hypothetical protein
MGDMLGADKWTTEGCKDHIPHIIPTTMQLLHQKHFFHKYIEFWNVWLCGHTTVKENSCNPGTLEVQGVAVQSRHP